MNESKINEFTRIFALLFMFFIFIPFINADNILSHIESSYYSAYDKINKVYEITPSILKSSETYALSQNNAIRVIGLFDENYYIILTNITESNVYFLFSENRIGILKVGETLSVDLNRDGILDIQVKLEKINPNSNAIIYIKEYEPQSFVSGNYKELFDVILELDKNTIYSSSELISINTFKNFGDGASKINIIYSIKNEKGDEVYKGKDIKIVQTEDMVIKTFGFLNLSIGKYEISTEIFYGKNQTAESKKSFEIIKKPLFERIEVILVMVIVIIILYLLIFLIKIFYRKKKIESLDYKPKKLKKRTKKRR